MQPEYELLDTGIFDGNRYFDVLAEYAKATPDDVWLRLTLTNRGPETADAPRAAHPLVPQHLGLGAEHRGLLAASGAAGRGRQRCWPGTPRSG